jgi:hypothetical protein
MCARERTQDGHTYPEEFVACPVVTARCLEEPPRVRGRLGIREAPEARALSL